jgi:1-acyl-sn-glycerol-3-phosphate acyltransferase
MTWHTATEPAAGRLEPQLEPTTIAAGPSTNATGASRVPAHRGRLDLASMSLSSHAHPQPPSRALLRFFDVYLSVYVPLHFNALRLASPERFPRHTRPLIVVINHPSWWDPLTSILISRFLLRGANHYAPIDAHSLVRYSILGKLGLFPVEQGTPRGAVQFLRAAQSILADPHALLWLTPQGGFTDVRSRPVTFKSGLGSLIKRLDQVTVLPMAYEYTYWNERRPEILAQCGEPMVFTRGLVQEDAATHPSLGDLSADPGERIAAALAATQDELAGRAGARDPGGFQSVMGGEASLGMFRAMGRSLLAALSGAGYYGQPGSVEPGSGERGQQPAGRKRGGRRP